MSAISRADREQLASLARKHGKLAGQMTTERAKALMADVEDQLATQFKFDDEVWAGITREAQSAVAVADARIAEMCRSWGVPEGFRPGLSLSWYDRGENAAAGRRAELRKMAQARIDATVASAKVTIAAQVLQVETELVREGLDSAEAHTFLASLPTAEALLPQFSIGELERGRWEPPAALTAAVLTPSGGSVREQRRQAVARAITANPDGSDRAIARMAGVDHKTVANLRAGAGESPAEPGELPTRDSDEAP